MDLFNVNNPVTIVIADDHEIVRAGLKRILLVEKSFKVVDDVTNGKEAVEMVSYHQPHVILLDILMPEMDGIEAVPLIKKLSPGTMVLMLTAFEDSMHLEKAISAGADGYLSKDISSKDLATAIKKAVLGERVFSKSILALLENRFGSNLVDPEPISISKREQEVLNEIAKGKTNQEIAEVMGISVRTVETHRYNLMQKLQCSNTASLIRYAVTHELTKF